MRSYRGEVLTGPKGGSIVVVSNNERAYEVHPLGDPRHREFYCKPAAIGLAKSSETFINEHGDANLHSSFVRRM